MNNLKFFLSGVLICFASLIAFSQHSQLTLNKNEFTKFANLVLDSLDYIDSNEKNATCQMFQYSKVNDEKPARIRIMTDEALNMVDFLAQLAGIEMEYLGYGWPPNYPLQSNAIELCDFYRQREIDFNYLFSYWLIYMAEKTFVDEYYT